MCNVILRYIHVTVIAVEKQELLNIMSVCLYYCLSFLACKLHIHYTVTCSLSGSTIFSHYLINGMIFEGGKKIKHKICFYFLYKFGLKHFLIAHRSHQILMKLEFSRQTFKKYSYIKFHENTFSGSRVV